MKSIKHYSLLDCLILGFALYLFFGLVSDVLFGVTYLYRPASNELRGGGLAGTIVGQFLLFLAAAVRVIAVHNTVMSDLRAVAITAAISESRIKEAQNRVVARARREWDQEQQAKEAAMQQAAQEA